MLLLLIVLCYLLQVSCRCPVCEVLSLLRFRGNILWSMGIVRNGFEILSRPSYLRPVSVATS